MSALGLIATQSDGYWIMRQVDIRLPASYQG
jgi:hypothetical protein